MSKEKITTGGNVIEDDDADAGGQEDSAGCLQLSTLCCCIPRRRRRLPGRKPKDRKKKNEKKKNAGDASFNDAMSDERNQTMGQDHRSVTPAGDSGGVQTEGIKPALTVCIQISDRTTADFLIPVTLDDICLEGREEKSVEKTSGNTLCTQNKKQQKMEEPENVLFLEPGKESIEDAVSEGVLREEGKGHLVTTTTENRQCGRPELLSALLQGTTYKKEPEGTEDGVIFKSEDVPSEPMKEDQLDVPSQEQQQSRELALSSTLAANENKLDKEHNTSTNSEGENSLQDHELVLDLTCKVDRQVTQNQMMSVYKGDPQSKNEEYQDISNEKMKPSTEPECPDILSTICENYEWQEQQNLDFATEASSNKVEHHYLNLPEQKDQPPVIPNVANFSFQARTHEKIQGEVQIIKSSSSDISLSKSEDHQCRPHQEDQRDATSNNMSVRPADVTCTIDLQNLAHTNPFLEDVAIHITDQNHTETQQLFLLEQTTGCCYSGSDEHETQAPIVTLDVNICFDNISHEKEQQRKLECGDSEPEGIYDKKDQDQQGTGYLEMQQLAVFAEPLKAILGEDQCVKKEDMNPGQTEIYLPDEESTEPDDQYKLPIFTSSKEEATTQQQQRRPLIMSTREGWNKEEEQPEARLIQKDDASLPYEEQQKREQMNLGVTCETHQKETQGLSDIVFLCNARKEEEDYV